MPRNALATHNKFFRHKYNPGSINLADMLGDSRYIFTSIKSRLASGAQNSATILDGKPARSVIIALNRLMEQNLTKPNTSLNFKIGNTTIKWQVKSDHGKVFLSVNSARNSLLSSFPYGTALAAKLAEIERKLKAEPKNLMLLIIDKFSTEITPFSRDEFTQISKEEVDFLNAFSFLIQVAEVARYLPTGVSDNRDITKLPIGIAIAVAKLLKVEGSLSWMELYGDVKPDFKEDKTVMEAHIENGTYVRMKTVAGMDSMSFNGYDPVAGKNLKNNYNIILEKISLLKAKRPEHLEEILSSATATAGFLRSVYGSGYESDDSNYSEVEDAPIDHPASPKAQELLKHLGVAPRNIAFASTAIKSIAVAADGTQAAVDADLAQSRFAAIGQVRGFSLE
jgi:hypothetical protein